MNTETRESPANLPLKKRDNRSRRDGKLMSSVTRRMEARIIYLENELKEAKLWIADLYEKLKSAKQGARS